MNIKNQIDNHLQKQMDNYFNKQTPQDNEEWQGHGTLPDDYQEALDEQAYMDKCDKADRDYMIKNEDREPF